MTTEGDELRSALRPLLEAWAEQAAVEAVQAHREELDHLRQSLEVRWRREA